MRHPAWIRGAAEEFARLHQVHPFDVVHSESTSALGLLRRGFHRSIPFAVKFHGNYLGLAGASIARAARARDFGSLVTEAKYVVWITGHHVFPSDALYRFRACEAMVPSRQQLAGTSRSLLLRRDRVHVVPNGVDANRYRPRSRPDARSALGLDDGPILLCVARLDREKGIHLAIEALRGLDGVTLVVVGEGVERHALERLAESLAVSDRVVFADRQTREAVASYMAAADIFVFPTEREEAAPLVVPEAMACGLPVVASRIGGITEVIDAPGENGVLIPSGNVDALRTALAQLLGDPDARRRIGEAARARVEQEYTIERMVERTLAVYEIARRRLMAEQ
jgi:glycosyltransferase involved in cell wall biosynthesis